MFISELIHQHIPPSGEPINFYVVRYNNMCESTLVLTQYDTVIDKLYILTTREPQIDQWAEELMRIERVARFLNKEAAIAVVTAMNNAGKPNGTKPISMAADTVDVCLAIVRDIFKINKHWFGDSDKRVFIGVCILLAKCSVFNEVKTKEVVAQIVAQAEQAKDIEYLINRQQFELLVDMVKLI